MATFNKDFKIKRGLTVSSEGITFSNGSVQTVASDGGGAGLTVDSVFPGSPSNGSMHLDTVSNRVFYYYDNQWYSMANHDDTLNVTEHTHNSSGFVENIYQYNGNGVVLPNILDSWSPLDGGVPSSTYSLVIDGGSAA